MGTVQLQPGDDFAKALDELPGRSELLLPRGAVFEVTRTPTVRRDDVRIAAAGDPVAPPPLVRSRGCGGLYGVNRRNVTVAGVHFACVGPPTEHGISFLRTRGLTLEDLDVSGYTFGIAVQAGKPGESADVTVRRCHIHDNWHPTRKHSSGLYVSCTERLVIEHNVFDTNGWRPGTTAATDQNHNCYLQSDNGPAVVRGNVFANGSSHGLQQRCGGVCEGNVFVDNAIHQSYGLINGAAGFVGGVSGVVRGNVYVGSRDINGTPRGWALELANVLDVELSDLLVAHDRSGNAIAIQVNVPQRVTNADKLVGVVDLRIRPTVFVWDWPKGRFWKNGSISPTGTGIRRLGKLVCPDRWDPPVKADLTRVVNLATVRAVAREMGLTRVAAELIRVCREACGLEGSTTTTTPPPPPPPPAPPPAPVLVPALRLTLIRASNGEVLREDLRDGDAVADDTGVVAAVINGSGAAAAAAVRFHIDGRLVREERTPPLSMGGDDGPGKVKPFDFPSGPFVLAVESIDRAGVVLTRREVKLTGSTPDVQDVPDVPGALARAIAARDLLPGDPAGARVEVERVIDLLT